MVCHKSFMKMSSLVLAVFMITVCNAKAVESNKALETNNPGQQELVKVSTLGSVVANQEFQKNVQIMQSQRQRLIQLQTQLEQTQTDELKISLKKEIKAALKKINDDNKMMVDTYGFSLNRNYVLVVEKAHVYMTVSPEEKVKIDKENKEKKKKTSKK